MTDPAKRERAAMGVLNRLPDDWRVGALIGLVIGRLSLALALVAACDAIAPGGTVPMGNDPLPLPADLAALIDNDPGIRLMPADGSVPQISPTKAVEIAGKALFDDLDGNLVPRQDASVPDALVRRLMTNGPEPWRSVWLVAYRWKAGFDCLTAEGGPGPCRATSFYYIDDRTGELVLSGTDTRE